MAVAILDHLADGRQVHEANCAARREAYDWLRSTGCSREAAARRVGVSVRTAWRYEAALRAAARRA